MRFDIEIDEFPAHAGMNRSIRMNFAPSLGVPRTRGMNARAVRVDGQGQLEFPAHAG